MQIRVTMHASMVVVVVVVCVYLEVDNYSQGTLGWFRYYRSFTIRIKFYGRRRESMCVCIRTYFSSNQYKNLIPDRFVVNSSQMSSNRLIWCLYSLISVSKQLKKNPQKCILFQGLYVGRLRGTFIYDYSLSPSFDCFPVGICPLDLLLIRA